METAEKCKVENVGCLCDVINVPVTSHYFLSVSFLWLPLTNVPVVLTVELIHHIAMVTASGHLELSVQGHER